MLTNYCLRNVDAFKACLARANRALAAGTFPTTVLGFIEDDIQTTLPSLHLFAPGKGPLYQDLKDMLCAWVVARSDEGLGYVAGVAKIAAMLLINMAASDKAFIAMRNLLDRGCLRAFYGGSAAKDDVSEELIFTLDRITFHQFHAHRSRLITGAVSYFGSTDITHWNCGFQYI